jgi:prepilin-type N-terminal cleavage/methylation domain-containing protein
MDTQDVIPTTEKKDKGFTLVELLIVIVILGVLATVTVFAVSGITSRGETTACQADLNTLRTAAEAYYAENGSYAALETDLTPGFIATASSKYAYTGAAGSYSITVQDADCGTVGAAA